MVVKRIGELDKRKDVLFVSTDVEVQAINDTLPKRFAGIFSAFFVKEKDGEYVEIWGVEQSVPRLRDYATRVK